MAGTNTGSPYFLGYYMQVDASGLADPTNPAVNPVWTPGFGTYYLGLITNAFDVATGKEHPPSAGRVQIETAKAPVIAGAEALWVFGGADGDFNKAWGSPGVPTVAPVQSSIYPGESSKSTIQNLRQWTTANGWAGVDFDDELSSASASGAGFDAANLGQLINELDQDGRVTSYSVVGGYDLTYGNQPYIDLQGVWVASSGAIDRVQLMVYADKMWDKATRDQYVPSSIKAVTSGAPTVKGIGVPAEKVILGVTTSGLDSDSLQDWINAVTGRASSYSPNARLGGLFVFQGATQPVAPDLMQQIQGGLGRYEPTESDSGPSPAFALSGDPADGSTALAGPDGKGSRYSDIIIGDSGDESARSDAGGKVVDRLTGKGSGDLFVLGVGARRFYEGGGRRDVAFIKDFSLKQADRLQLSGDAQDYQLIRGVNYGGHQGLAVATQSGDWIAFLRKDNGVQRGLDLSDPFQVVFVE